MSVISIQVHTKTVELNYLGKIGNVQENEYRAEDRSLGTPYRIRTVGGRPVLSLTHWKRSARYKRNQIHDMPSIS